MDLKDDDGLYEDLFSDVWCGNEDWYGVFEFVTSVLNPIRLEEDEIYTWTKFIMEEYF